jgi:hypothetical protein
MWDIIIDHSIIFILRPLGLQRPPALRFLLESSFVKHTSQRIAGKMKCAFYAVIRQRIERLLKTIPARFTLAWKTYEKGYATTLSDKSPMGRWAMIGHKAPSVLHVRAILREIERVVWRRSGCASYPTRSSRVQTFLGSRRWCGGTSR